MTQSPAGHSDAHTQGARLPAHLGHPSFGWQHRPTSCHHSQLRQAASRAGSAVTTLLAASGAAQALRGSPSALIRRVTGNRPGGNCSTWNIVSPSVGS